MLGRTSLCTFSLAEQSPDMMTNKNINAVTEDLKTPKQPTKNKINVSVEQGLFSKQAEHPGEPGGVSEVH